MDADREALNIIKHSTSGIKDIIVTINLRNDPDGLRWMFSHVHDSETGRCIKNRYGPKCDTSRDTDAALERVRKLADDFDGRADEADRRSLGDANAYARRVVWESAAAHLRAALDGERS